MINFSQRSYR